MIVYYIPVRTSVVEPVSVDGAAGGGEREGQSATGIIRVQNVDLVRNQRIATQNTININIGVYNLKGPYSEGT